MVITPDPLRSTSPSDWNPYVPVSPQLPRRRRRARGPRRLDGVFPHGRLPAERVVHLRRGHRHVQRPRGGGEHPHAGQRPPGAPHDLLHRHGPHGPADQRDRRLRPLRRRVLLRLRGRRRVLFADVGPSAHPSGVDAARQLRRARPEGQRHRDRRGSRGAQLPQPRGCHVHQPQARGVPQLRRSHPCGHEPRQHHLRRPDRDAEDRAARRALPERRGLQRRGARLPVPHPLARPEQ